MKQKIICIVGPSGCGKTTLSLAVQEKLGIKALVSYTTRPKRENETDGVDHYFVDDSQVPPVQFQLAYTRFGGYQYWVDIRDLPQNEPVLYVIDEKGLMYLLEKWSDKYDIRPILIKRDKELLINTVGKERVNRDKYRIKIEENCYEAIIYNNYTLSEFCNNGTAIIQTLIL